PVRSLELAKGAPRGEQVRLAMRGAATTIYASPQQTKKEPPAPTDDVHALGVIWYQLLKRDPAVGAPIGAEWVDEFAAHGFTETQGRVLQSCLSTRPDKRPKDAGVLAEQLGQVTVAPRAAGVDDGSKLISLKAMSGPQKASGTHRAAPPPLETDAGPMQSNAAANIAAAMLSAAGGGPL